MSPIFLAIANGVPQIARNARPADATETFVLEALEKQAAESWLVSLESVAEMASTMRTDGSAVVRAWFRSWEARIGTRGVSQVEAHYALLAADSLKQQVEVLRRAICALEALATYPVGCEVTADA